ncbi:MAG: oligosaccharide repeat unit polymerase [Thiomicrospira sp.]|nr:oligosaccharide repeat unit polymerase [Thiomicrospira sp.]
MNANPSNLRWFFSPAVLYFVGFIVPFLLVFIGFSKEVSTPHHETLNVILLGVLGFYLGIALVYSYFAMFRLAFFPASGANVGRMLEIDQEKILFMILVTYWILAIGLLWFEFYKLGALPLLSSAPEELRFLLQVNGYVHLVAISSGYVAFVFFALFHISSNTVFKIFYAVMIIMTLISLLMTANRIDFLYPIFLMILFYAFFRGNLFKKEIVYSLFFLLLVFVFVNVVRSSGHDLSYMDNNYAGLGEGFEPTYLNLSLYPFYMTLTYNFEMLNKLVEEGISNVTDGLYTFYAFYSLAPGQEESFGEFKNRVLGIDFYAELTSTYLSNFYVDFGKLGVFMGSLIYAILVQSIWEFSKVSRKNILLYSVVAGPLLFLFYAFYYVYFYAVFQIILIVFILFFIRPKFKEA